MSDARPSVQTTRVVALAANRFLSSGETPDVRRNSNFQAGEILGLRSLCGGLGRVLIASDGLHALAHCLTESAGRIGTPKIPFCVQIFQNLFPVVAGVLILSSFVQLCVCIFC